jgi:hypothetical protein
MDSQSNPNSSFPALYFASITFTCVQYNTDFSLLSELYSRVCAMWTLGALDVKWQMAIEYTTRHKILGGPSHVHGQFKTRRCYVQCRRVLSYAASPTFGILNILSLRGRYWYHVTTDIDLAIYEQVSMITREPVGTWRRCNDPSTSHSGTASTNSKLMF